MYFVDCGVFVVFIPYFTNMLVERFINISILTIIIVNNDYKIVCER